MDSHRLPRTVLPVRYDVELVPDLTSATFTGTVRIEATVAADAPVTTVVLNAADLEVEAATVDGAPATWWLDPVAERLSLTPAEPLTAGGPTVIHLTFSGALNDKLKGFYRSSTTAADGTTRTIATTQMQSTDCRRAFPCFDEPDFKAVFGVTLVVAPGLLAVSNGPEVARHHRPDGTVAVRFADTMPMSSYLVAFVVGDLEATHPVDVDGIPLRVVHVPGRGHLTGFALDCAAFCLRWFQDWYGIPYPGEKVDLVAIPDFAAGAMENLGCITFREVLLLVDPAVATLQEQQAVADVIAHELAHMWFGDLVTMGWWNGIWLNEAFATFMEIKACDAYRPEWDRWTQFGLERTAAFDVDGLRSTRPVEFEVHSPQDAEGMFDVLTYQKGGAVLRMLEQHLGEEPFRLGIRRYLERHAYANTETADLWDALEEATGAPVRTMMDGWIWQGGHPIVSADVRNGHVELHQRRFLFDPHAAGGPDHDHGGDGDVTVTWDIPVVLPDGSRVLLGPDPLRVPDRGHPYLLNPGAHGFYRSEYGPALRSRLAGPALASCTPLERYQLLDDAWAAVVAGDLRAAHYCEFARGFADDDELPVWQVLLSGLSWCDRFLDGAARAHFQAWVRALVGPALHRLGAHPVPGERAVTGELRGTLLRALAVLGDDPDARARARDLSSAVLAGHDVDPSLGNAAVGVVAATGALEDHTAFVERFRSAATPQDVGRFLYALADFPHPEAFTRTLQLSISGDVRSQNAPFLLQRALRNRAHGPQAWRFVREHWAELNDRLPSNSIIRMVDGVKALTRPEDVTDVAAFFAEHPVPQAARTLAQTLERQRIHAALRAREAGPLAEAFSS